MADKKKKIIRYKKPKNINPGIIIFAFIFIYLIVCIFQYMTKEKVQVYEVVKGNIASTSYYTGIIKREETLVSSDFAGTINYYLREKSRTAVNGLIYTVDETGQLTEYLEKAAQDGSSLSQENLSALHKDLSQFSTSYDDMNFTSVYDIISHIDASLLDYLSNNILSDASGSMAEAGIAFQRGYSQTSGIVVYAYDGLEGLSNDNINNGLFTQKNDGTYQKTVLTSGQSIGVGDTAYKIITSEDWSIYIPISEEDMLSLEGETTVRINFTGTGLSANATFEILIGTDGNSYARLDLSRYMVQFAKDRYVDIEIVHNQIDGLKIPKSSVVSKDFYLIPVSYLTTGGDGTTSGFLKQVYTEGNLSTEFVDLTIYQKTEDYCYVDTNDIEAGEVVLMPDSNETYTIGEKSALQGVYNVNKGYAVFQEIEIINENEEYYIVTNNTTYGLSVYDQIILNASAASESEIIY